MSALAILALLLLGQAAPAPRGAVDSSADQLVFTPSSHALQLLGHARLQTEGLLLRADEIDYDPESGKANARAHVLFASGMLAGTAQALDLDLTAQEGLFRDATLFQKSRTTPQALAEARTPAELRLLGRNEITLRADLVRRLGPQTFEAEGLYATPCDCREGTWRTEPPSWSIRARSARVSEGESARLRWARLYIKDVPTLPVPVLLLPLSSRQTGFLLPRPNYTARNGFQLEQPFFWATSRSVDATFTPGYFFGVPGDAGMKGPRLDTELRYVPSLSTQGKLTLVLVEDLKRHGSGAERGGPRGDLTLTHVQSLGHGFEDRVDAAAISDQTYFRDVTTDIVVQQLDYLRSDARLEHRTASTVLTLSGSYTQALRGTPVDTVQAPLAPFFGPHNVNAFTFQRLPALAFAVPEVGLGPTRGELEVDAVRYAPLSAQTCPTSDPSCPPVARQITDRVGLTRTAALPLLLGRFGELVPYLLLRGDAWHVDAPEGPTRLRLLAMFGARAQTELARVFTASDGVRYRHVLAPALEVRAIPWVAGLRPDLPNDELDAPSGTLRQPAESAPAEENPISADHGAPLHPLQAVAVLRTRIDRKQGDALTEPLRAEVGQGYDLARSSPADTFARLAAQWGPVSGGGELRYALTQRRVAAVSGRLGYLAPGGSAVNLRYQRLRRSLTDPMRAGLFDLVGAPPDSNAAGESTVYLAEQLDLGARLRPSPWVSLEGGVSYLPNAVGLRVVNAPDSPLFQRLLSYSAGLTYGSPCDCWGLRLSAIFNPTVTSRPWVPTSFMVVLDAHRLGGNFGN